MAIEVHPFEDFIPKNINYLLLGSFTAKDSRKGIEYDWYYSNGRNQFWNLIEKVYDTKLETIDSKVELFTNLGIGITDIIYKCNRTKNSSLDNALDIIEYNPRLEAIISRNLKSVFFSSRFVETQFKRNFSELIDKYQKTKFIYLPSPSPRYAAMSKEEKVLKYKELLPKL
ncbi:hypothetical protein KC669_02565 [Candidatus Dojkabacteria bacterium]|uniref:DNA-deoxyinosine glycosylase n=1 Tax=Candidatus Dojkabacteria bacterium TaxID=2099670 RepID=A0A955LAN8_9BACT|nr:hypothetical protein [Candidatus Dojkabacteria bacterium]